MRDTPHTSEPRRIGPYEVIRPLARGRTAEVFLARYTAGHGFEKLVVIKRVLPELALDRDSISMFIDEANITASLNHTNIGQVFEFGEVDNTFFLAMEYVHGVNLKEVIDFYTSQGLAAPFPMAVYCVKEVCVALEYVHALEDRDGAPRGIIHRAISPSNIMLSYEGDVKLIDFGIVKAAQRVHQTEYATIKGKMAYMSPEQAAGAVVDQRTDVYGCGVTLYELITGVNPFAGQDVAATLDKMRLHQIAPPTAVNPDIPRELEAICMRALAKAPAQRYSSAGRLREALELFAAPLDYGRRQVRHWIDANFQHQRSADLLAFDQMETEKLPAKGLERQGTSLPPPIPQDAGDEEAEPAESKVKTEEEMENPFGADSGPIKRFESIDDGPTVPDTLQRILREEEPHQRGPEDLTLTWEEDPALRGDED